MGNDIRWYIGGRGGLNGLTLGKVGPGRIEGGSTILKYLQYEKLWH